MGANFMKIEVPHASTLIVTFTGHALMYHGVPKFEFVNCIELQCPTISGFFCMDPFLCSYHSGIKGISTNIETTAEFLQKEIAPYKKVIFMGASSGGYAAILFGSLLNVHAVIAFIPQTVIRSNHPKHDPAYKDIAPFINNTTHYFMYGDKSIQNPLDSHHMVHCERIRDHANVYIHYYEHINLKRLRDRGELLTIIKTVTETPMYRN